MRDQWPRRTPMLLAGPRVLALLGAIALATADLPAQEPTTLPAPPVAVGQRVRISTAPAGRRQIAGTIDSVLARAFVIDTVGERRRRFLLDPGPAVLDQFRRVTIRFTEIERLEVSRGIDRWRGVLRWGLIGAAGGALLGGAANSSEINPTAKEFLTGAGSGAAVGGIVGGAVGYFLGRERWQAVPKPAVPSPTRPSS